MINRKKKSVCGLAFLLAACMVFSACSEEPENADNGKKERVHKPSVPSIGVTRIMPEVHEPKAFTVMIDPGHGYTDGGTGDGILPDGLLEKDITLAIAKKLNEDLTEYGFQVMMTHDGEIFPRSSNGNGNSYQDDGNDIYNIYERSKYANTLDIDYFISIHVNSHTNSEAQGVRTYYIQNWRKNDETSKPLTQYVTDSVRETFPMSPTPVMHNDSKYIVLTDTNAAATLVEIGFCTNPTDAANMIQPEWQEQMAQAMADGIHQYYTDNIEIPS